MVCATEARAPLARPPLRHYTAGKFYFGGEVMARLLPTTRAQVSGHQFMRRRVEHGLIFGDIRMIHDPLASRRRAMVFGLAAVVMIAGVMGLFAWMRPNPNPGDAAIMRAADGSLYVRVGEEVHPVTNLASARLIAGSPDEPARVGDEHLAAMGRGIPVGLITAPGMFAPKDAAHAAWSACEHRGKVTVVAGEAVPALEDTTAVLASDGTRDWLVTAQGRQLLPPTTTAEGRIVRRVIGITHATPVWAPPTQVLNALRELPEVSFPTPSPQVLDTDEGSWMLIDGAIQPITDTQRDMLTSAGASAKTIRQEQLADYPDSALDLRLPGTAPEWIDPTATAICAAQDGTAAATDDVPEGVALSGTSVATHFAGLEQGSVGVDSGHGFHVVAANGLRHRAPDHDTLTIVGAHHVEEVPWEIVGLLPEGEELTREAALTATY